MSSPAHAGQHSDVNDAVEALEATLGLNPEGAYATVAARMLVVDLAADAAAASAVSSESSAQGALQSNLDAAAASLLASQWATKLIDPVESTNYSAKFNANLAAASALQAADLYDLFDDRFLGAKAVAPTLDNDGNALVAGVLYFDTVYVAMYVYTGTVWIDAATSLFSWSGPVTISANGTVAALRITQTGTGDVLLVEDEATDTTPLRVTADGSVIVLSTVSAEDSGRFTGHGAITLCTNATRPAAPSEGDIIYETETDLFFGYNGVEWTSIGGGSVAYQTTPPTINLSDGVLWIDSDGQTSVLNANDYYQKIETYNKAEVLALLQTAGFNPFFLIGV